MMIRGIKKKRQWEQNAISRGGVTRPRSQIKRITLIPQFGHFSKKLSGVCIGTMVHTRYHAFLLLCTHLAYTHILYFMYAILKRQVWSQSSSSLTIKNGRYHGLLMLLFSLNDSKITMKYLEDASSDRSNDCACKNWPVEDSRGPLDWLINAFLFVLVAIVAFERVHGFLKFLICTLEIITSLVNSAEDHRSSLLVSLLKLADLSDCKLFFQTLPQLRQPESFPEYLHQGALKYRFSWQKE